MTRVSLILAMWAVLTGAIAEAALAPDRSRLALLALSVAIDVLAAAAVLLELQPGREGEPEG